MIIRLILVLTVLSILVYGTFVGMKMMKPEHALIALKALMCFLVASLVLTGVVILF